MMRKLLVLLAVFGLCILSSQAQTFVWANDPSGASIYSGVSDIATDTNGDYVVTGFAYNGTFGIDTIDLTMIYYDGYVAKFNEEGDVLWAHRMGGAGQDGARNVAIDDDGNIFVSGVYSGSATIADTTVSGTASNDYDAYLAKFDTDGDLLWVRVFTGSGNVKPTGLVADHYGDVYIQMVFDGSLFIGSSSYANTSTASAAYNDEALAKYDEDGNFVWKKHIKSASYHYVSSYSYLLYDYQYYAYSGGLAVDNNSNLYIIGNFSSDSLTLDSTIFVNGYLYADAYIAKLDTGGSVSWLKHGGGTSHDFFTGIAIDASDNIFVTGFSLSSALFGSVSLSNTGYGLIMRYNTNGVAQSGNRFVGNSWGHDIDVDTDGNFYVSGLMYSANSSVSVGGSGTFSSTLANMPFYIKRDYVNNEWDYIVGGSATGTAQYGRFARISAHTKDRVFAAGQYYSNLVLGDITLNDAYYTGYWSRIANCEYLVANAFTIGNDTIVCDGEEIEVYADTNSSYEYQWLYNGAAITGEINDSYTVDDDGDYAVVIDSGGCVDTSNIITITVADPPTVTHTNFSSVCDGDDPFQMTGGSPAGGSYSGSAVVGGDTFDPSIAVLGTNIVYYSYTDSNGCADSVSKTITVGQSPAIFTTSLTACEGDGPISLAGAAYGFPTGGTHTGPGVVGNQFYPGVAGAGTHYIYYYASNGCYAADSIQVVVTASPNVNLTAPSTACASSVTPIVLTGTPSGGTFTWNSINSQLFYPSLAGIGNVMVTYSVTASGCTAIDTEYVFVDTVPTVSISPFPTLCEGDDTLDLSSYGTPSGGTFSGTGVSSNVFDPSVSSTGTFTLSYSYTNGCGSYTDTESITVGPSPNISTSTSDVSCNGGNDGSATATGSGASSPYSYAWSNSASTATATGLTAGTYTVTVTDNNGCEETATVTINEPTALAVVTSSSAASCNGGNDGAMSAIGTGGTSPYGYAWSNGSTSSIVSGVSAGTYTVTVTDANGCTETETVTVTEPTAVTANISSQTNVSCNGGNDGSATASGSGGTSPYSYTWSGGGTAATKSGLSAGTYTVTVTDNNGCSDVETVTITEPTVVVASIGTPTNVSCNGGNDGSATASGSGGTSPYSYAWSGGAGSAATATGLSAGTYTVTVTDANGCEDTENVTITEPATSVSVSISASSNASCNGASDGSATASGSGGTGSISYSWSGGAGSSATATGLSAGTYTVTASDDNGCSATATVTITEPTAVIASIGTPTNASCNGASDGSATASGSGGTSPYSYNWSSGSTYATASSLAAGTYTVTVTDANGCDDTETVTITEPTAVTASISSQTNVSCNGGNDGSATASGSGGTSPYTFAWSGGGTAATKSGLTAGTYTVTVTDANGCDDTETVTITEPTTVVASIGTPTNVSCNGGNDGSATASGSGGTSPYSYAWSGGAGSSATATGLSAGTYTVTVTDANGCDDTETVTITEPATSVSVSIASSSNVSCNGGNDGSATASGSGGTGSISYSWSGGAGSSTSATALSAGTYTVTATDDNGCSATAIVTITEPTVVVASISSSSNVSCNGGNDGSATASGSGGTAPYSYAWSNSSTGATVTGLSVGTYTVTVTDANGCDDTETVTITEPPAISISLSATNVSCNGAADGSISSTVTGGTSGYTYAWSTGSTNATVTGLGPATYTLTVTDANGCTETASESITQPAPLTASASMTSTVSCIGGNDGEAAATWSGGTSPLTYAWSSGATTATATGLTVGTFTVTITDANSCTATATATITQSDSTAPVVMTIDTLNVYLNVLGVYQLDTTEVNIGTFDNCGLDTMYLDISSFDCSNVGSLNEVWLYAEDGSGNLDSSNTLVLVYDTVSPDVFVGPDTTIYLDASGNISITANEINDGSSDACGIDTLYLSQSDFDCSDVGANEVWLYAVDINGNLDSNSLEVIVIDTIVPAVTTQNVTLYLDSFGMVQLDSATAMNAGTFDACGVVSYSVSDSIFTCDDIGTNTITFFATDVNGNVGSETGIITVLDSIAPVVIALDTTVYLDATGNATLTTAAVDLGSSDNCAIDSMWISQSTFDCADTGSAISVVLYVQDSSGNIGSETFLVTVVDSMAPTILTINATLYLDASGMASLDASIIDNGSNDNCQVDSIWLSKVDFNCSDIGLQTITFYAVDVSGNMDSSTAIVTVMDTIAPVVVANDTTVYLDTSGTVLIDPTHLNTLTFDSCGIASMWLSDSLFSCADTGAPNLVWLYVQDVNGNVDSSSGLVSVFDTIAPSAIPYTAWTLYLNSSGTVSLTAAMADSATNDNCSVQSISIDQTLFDCSDLGSNTITFTAIDESGNVASSSLMVHVFDTITTISINVDSTILCEGGSNGVVTASASGISSGYSYAWNSGHTTATANGLSAGTYYVTATSSGGCEIVDSVTLTDPVGMEGSLTAQDVTCFGGNDGWIAADVSGGTAGYSFNWSNSSSLDSIAGLTAGTYTVTITDANGCSITMDTTLTSNPQILSTITSNVAGLCTGDSTGIISVEITGGVGSYDLIWDINGDTASSDTVENVPAGTYYLFITDSLGCYAFDSITIDENMLPAVSFNMLEDTVCSGETVSLLNVSPAGGSWSGTGVNGSVLFTDSIQGMITVTYDYTDSNGCSSSAMDSVFVLPLANITFDQNPIELCAGEMVNLDFAQPAGGIYSSPFISGGMLVAPDTAYNGLGGQYIFQNSCGIDSAEFFMMVHPSPIVNLGDDTTLCNASSLMLDAGSFEGYVWSTGATSQSILINEGEEPLVDDQTVWVIVEDSLGCKGSDTIEIDVIDQPTFYLGDNIHACMDSVITLTVPNVYDNFLWSDSSTGTSILAHNGSFVMPGWYPFWVTGYDIDGCSFADTIYIRLYDCDSVLIGLDDLNGKQFAFDFYPNPASNVVNLSFNASVDGLRSVSIHGAMGEMVRTYNPSDWSSVMRDQEVIVPLGELPNGVYVIRIDHVAGSATRPLIITR